MPAFTPGRAVPALIRTTEARTDGEWSYRSGAAGTEVLPPGSRVTGIAATCTASPGSLVINGGPAISIPANDAIEISPQGSLIAPSLVFDSTAAYAVEFVTD